MFAFLEYAVELLAEFVMQSVIKIVCGIVRFFFPRH